MRKKSYGPLIMLAALLLVVGGVVSGTVAWLIADTEPVVNTFTYGDINLTLEETELDINGNTIDKDGDGNPDKTSDGNTYEMIPGKGYTKDPTVTVLAGNEACWLFVKLEEEGGATIVNAEGTRNYGFDDYLKYDVVDSWTELVGLVDAEGKPVEGIYFRYVGEDTGNTEVSYDILANNTISVQDTVTKEMLNALDGNGQDKDNATYPKLSVTAYAIQYSGFEAEISEDAEEPTDEQMNAAALNAWQAIEAQNNSANS